tara:strand:- start:837 stop:1070 length:234 start_codon:yes stop_codon:yes gene_type:complete
MELIIDFLEKRILQCEELGGMDKEKWAFKQCLKEARKQALLIQRVVQQSEQLPTECVENWDKPYYCKSELGRCKKCS